VLIIARQRKSNKKLTLIKQLFFLDKLIFRRSEISNDAVLVVYKNEVGLLSETLKLDITDGSREKWCSKIEEAKVDSREIQILGFPDIFDIFRR
jgi:hypothetical protein